MEQSNANKKPKMMTTADECYFIAFEGNLKFKDIDGSHVTRREYVVRHKDIGSLLYDNNKSLKRIQILSGATIAIASSVESTFHYHHHLELWGSYEQVEAAKSLLVDEMKKMYKEAYVPTLLMKAPVTRSEVCVPLTQATRLFGKVHEKIVELEALSGAWIEVDPLEPPSVGHLWMRRANVFGSCAMIHKIMVRVNEAMLEPYMPEGQESANLEEKEVVPDPNNI